MSVGGGNWAKIKFSVANQHATSILYWKLKWMASGEVHISWWKNTKCKLIRLSWTFVFKSIDKTIALDRIRLLNRVGCYFVALIPDPEMADLSSRFSTHDHKWHVFDALCLESRAWTRFWNWVPISAFEDFGCSICILRILGFAKIDIIWILHKINRKACSIWNQSHLSRPVESRTVHLGREGRKASNWRWKR